MVIIQIAFWGLTTLLVLSCVLPLSKLPYGSIRGFAFPRLQWFWLSIALLPLAVAIFRTPTERVAIGILLVTAGVQAIYIAKFTRLWPRQSRDADDTDPQSHVSVLAANIKKSNRDYGALISLVQDENPDIAILVEVDADWIEGVSPLCADYPHRVAVPMDNGYGLYLLSRFALPEHDVRHLVTDGVPSIKATVALPSEACFRLYIVHPEPPVANHDTMGRDSEIALIGLEARDDPLPAIVTGDLNDVAWSTTTRRFQRMSRLLDPRVGRGFYNTFHAGIPFLRWPLDHLFHDARFRLIRMSRGRQIGSDHFPILFELALTPAPAGQEAVPAADRAEEQEAKAMIESEKKRDREAIGSHWEDDDDTTNS